MVDYHQPVGRSGVMMMRVNSDTVEFWVYVGWSGTWWGSAPWSWSSPNGSGSQTFGYPGGQQWVLVGAINVTTSGNVSWTVGVTGTSEFGGPHTQTVYVSRGTAPPAPTPLGIDLITHTSFRYRFQSNGTGGHPIIEWIAGYGTSPVSPSVFLSSTGTITIDDLNMGTKYYVWSRGRNALGLGPWSARREVTTLAGARVRAAGVWRNAIPYVKSGGVWKPAVPYVRSGGSWKSAAN